MAARLICEREKEIGKFKIEEYYTVETKLKTEKNNELIMDLISYDGKKYEIEEKHQLFDGEYNISKTSTTNEINAKEIVNDLSRQVFTVASVEEKETKRWPLPPYTTSTLQQDAGRKLGFSAKRTMQAAQKLYEEGLITYHRTDSVNLADKFLQEARDFINKEFGQKYLPEKPRFYQNKQKLAQEAHEAIRPTHTDMKEYTSENMTGRDMTKLYDLVWRRAMACQMKESLFNATVIEVTAGNYLLKTNGSVLLFDGFLKVWLDRNEDRILPIVTQGEKLNYQEALPKQHFTSPPPRYTEPSLIKSLEEKGIGRPSTYAPTLSTIQERQYVELEDKKFHPTALGIAVNDFLVVNFAEIVNIPFTVNMEDDLDAIANGEKQWREVIKTFYEPFIKILNSVQSNAERVGVKTEDAGLKCDKCGSPMVIRIGRFGKFIACSKFPECKNTKPLVRKLENFKCPQCASEVVIKKTKTGKSFYGCANYPNCKWASWTKPK